MLPLLGLRAPPSAPARRGKSPFSCTRLDRARVGRPATAIQSKQKPPLLGRRIWPHDGIMVDMLVSKTSVAKCPGSSPGGVTTGRYVANSHYLHMGDG